MSSASIYGWPCRFETDSTHFQAPPLAMMVRKGVGRPFSVLINEELFQELIRRTSQSPGTKLFGLLIGAPCTDSVEPFTLVEKHLMVQEGSGSPRSHLSGETWRRLIGQQEKLYPTLAPVGWFRSHPRGTVTLSDSEKELQSTHFALSHQIGLVGNPLENRWGVFGWDRLPPSGPRDISGERGFYLYRPAPPLLQRLGLRAEENATSLRFRNGEAWSYTAR